MVMGRAGHFERSAVTVADGNIAEWLTLDILLGRQQTREMMIHKMFACSENLALAIPSYETPFWPYSAS